MEQQFWTFQCRLYVSEISGDGRGVQKGFAQQNMNRNLPMFLMWWFGSTAESIMWAVSVLNLVFRA